MSKRRDDDYDFDLNVGNQLKKLRQDRNLSMQDISDRLNVSKMTVSRWESGEVRMYGRSLKDYCDCLNISLSEFFALIEEK